MKYLILISALIITSCSHGNFYEKNSRRPSSLKEFDAVVDESVDENSYLNVKYETQCKHNEVFIKESYKDKYAVKCLKNYHHYNSNWYTRGSTKTKRYDQRLAAKNGKLKIASFNIWHPGKRNTRFKDYSIVAKIMNDFDLVAGLELLPVLSHDEATNENLAKVFLTKHKEWDGITYGDKEYTIREWRKKFETLYKRSKRPETKQKYKEKLEGISELITKYSAAYKKAGYLIILDELRKLDLSWALLLSPWGEAAKKSDVHELVGFYYRSNIVRPKVNNYCGDALENRGDIRRNLFGCIPRFDRKIFSRRPFMASFESGNFDFTILASHVVFNSPSDLEHKKYILDKVYGVKSTKDLSKGNNASLYARFAEVKQITEFIEKLEQEYDEKNIIYAGDFNLEKSNPTFESFVFDNDGVRSEFDLLVDEKTSVTEQRVSKLEKTGGYASNYDHFILNPSKSTQCDIESAKRYNFLNPDSDALKEEFSKYLIRRPDVIEDVVFRINERPYKVARKIRSLTNSYKDKISKETVVKNDGEIVKKYGSEKELLEELYNYKQRIFGNQFHNSTFYRVYKELVSDHAPIEITCRTDQRDQD